PGIALYLFAYNSVTAVFSTLSLHDALPIFSALDTFGSINRYADYLGYFPYGSEVASSQPGSPLDKEEGLKLVLNQVLKHANGKIDRKSTRLNSSHVKNSYAVFCLKKEHTDI